MTYDAVPTGRMRRTRSTRRSQTRPFRLAEGFLFKALFVARCGVAILARTLFLEGVGHYKAIFHNHPPSKFAPFVERVPMLKCVWMPKDRRPRATPGLCRKRRPPHLRA